MENGLPDFPESDVEVKKYVFEVKKSDVEVKEYEIVVKKTDFHIKECDVEVKEGVFNVKTCMVEVGKSGVALGEGVAGVHSPPGAVVGWAELSSEGVKLIPSGVATMELSS